jgi:hypothetical protein
MSTVKNPGEKKRLSLKLDRRNRYGENSKASRKNIPRGKQRSNMNERRGVGQLLRGLSGDVNEDQAADAELRTNIHVVSSRRKGFKKQPDSPLGIVLDAKKARKSNSSA